MALAPGDVACVLAEPALTNIGIVLPEPGFHDALPRADAPHRDAADRRRDAHLQRRARRLHRRAAGSSPTCSRSGRRSAAAFPPARSASPTSSPDADRSRSEDADYEDVGGIGGTLAGNALSLAAVRATLGEVLTEEAFAPHDPRSARGFAAGVADVIEEAGVPWHVTELGARAEYRFSPQPPRNGAESAAAGDEELERFLHLYALNRGVLITPFHNMALVSPATSEADVDLHTRSSTAALEDLG